MSSFLKGLGHLLDHSIQYLPNATSAISCVKDEINKALEKHESLK